MSTCTDYIEQDRKLIERCLKGQSSAWETLYEQCHASVCDGIRSLLTCRNEELVDEIAASVWYRLVCDGCKLLASYDAAKRVRLASYLGAISKNAVRDYLRSERRRRHRQATHVVYYQSRTKPPLSSVEFDEFIEGLPNLEQRFLKWTIDPTASVECFTGTRNYDYQLRHRLRKKLHSFLR